MSIKSGSMKLSFFYVPDPVTEDFWGYVADHITKGIFKTCEVEDISSAGFVTWEDLFDYSFSNGYQKGQYMVFQFRLDQKKIPPMVLKQHLQQAIIDHKKEKGKFPSKKERQLLKETVKEELLHKAMACPSGFEVVWNPVNKRLILGTTSTNLIEAFLEKFESTFKVHPIPLYHLQLALHLDISPSLKDKISQHINPSSPKAFKEGRFIGYEFLTWLWFKAETQENSNFYLGDKLILSHPDNGKERIICSTENHSLEEARIALTQGKMLEEAQWILMVKDREYSFHLDVSLFTIKNLKTPSPKPIDGDYEGSFFERMFFIEEVKSTIEELYKEFLTTRFDPRWQTDILPLLKDWISMKAS